MVAAFAGAEEASARARALRAELLDAGERELHSYGPVLAAASPNARAEALAAASETPLAIARAAAEVAERAAEVWGQSSPALRGDAAAAVLLAEASAHGAARLVEINLKARPEDPRLAEVAQLRDRAAAARDRAAAARGRASG